jgi:hypothetical protein
MTRLASLGLLLHSLIGCTYQTPPSLPDGGDTMNDGGLDGGNDGGVTPDPTIETCTAESMGSTIGAACGSDVECDDGCYCNGVEGCASGTCEAGVIPCTDTSDCTADVCLEEANRCFHDPRHEMCSDGNACNGLELCDPMDGCRIGVPPYCNDEDSCTIDSCDTTMGCVYTPRDLDGDGYIEDRCGGEDCDDLSAEIFPGAVESCMNRRDDDCDGTRDYNDSSCRPTNDRCESAVVLAGPGTYSGSTSGLMSSYTLGCRNGGPDAVFRLSLTEMQDVQIAISGGGSGLAVALRTWDQCSSGPDEKCIQGTSPTLLRRSLPAGEYAIIVQTSSPGSPFDLNLRFMPPTEIPRIDVCNAETVDLCGGAPCTTLTGARFSGLYAETEDNYRTSCSGSGSYRDAVYQFTLDSPKDVTISASSTGSSSFSSTYLTLTTDCSTQGGELRCTASSSASIRQRELPAGTYFVVIESGDSSPSAWSLNVTITDPVPRNRGDACSNPVDISESTVGGGGSGVAMIPMLELDSGTSCGGGTSGRDATFFFTLTEVRDVTVTAQLPLAESWESHYASVAPACGRTDMDMRCWTWRDDGSASQSWRSLEPGTYFMTVSTTTDAGDIRASIATRDPTPIPPNDRCSGAIELTSGVMRRDTTIGFSDDGPGGSCSGTGRVDAYYRFTLPVSRNIILNVRDADGGTTPLFVTLRDRCESAGDLVNYCQASGIGTPSMAGISAPLPAGTYYVAVETPATEMSDFEIVLVAF